MRTNQTKTINTAWAVVLLLFSPSRLIVHSVDHALRSQPSEMTSERTNELRKSFHKQFSDSVSLLRRTLFEAFVIVAGAILVAYVSAVLLKTFSFTKSTELNAWLQYGGIGVLLWATLGRVDSPLQTWDGGTLPEKVDLWLYRWLYVVGSYALALSVAW